MQSVFNILIADDDPDDIELLEDAITTLEPKVKLLKFSSGNEAVKYLHSSADNELPCLIILDYNMPELKGSDTLSLIRSHKRYDSIAKVVISTCNSDLYKNECVSQGAWSYLIKPYNRKDLETLAKKLLSYCKREG